MSPALGQGGQPFHPTLGQPFHPTLDQGDQPFHPTLEGDLGPGPSLASDAHPGVREEDLGHQKP